MGGVSRLQQIRVILLKLNVLYCLENAFVSLKIVSIHGILLDFWGFVPRTHQGSAPTLCSIKKTSASYFHHFSLKC